MERLFRDSIIHLIPLFSATESNLNLELSPTKSRIKDIVSKIAVLNPRFLFPSLNIRSNVDHSDRNEKEQLHATFAQKLSVPVEYDSETIVDAPATLLHNISTTFVNLLDSRIHNSILAITERVTLPDAERNAIVHTLTYPSFKRVAITAAATRFKMLHSTADNIVMPLPPYDAYHLDSTMRIPITLECTMDLLLLSEGSINVQLNVMGSAVSGIGHAENGSPCRQMIMTLDTSSLLQSLVSEAHRVCKDLITIASELTLSKLVNQATGSPTVPLMLPPTFSANPDQWQDPSDCIQQLLATNAPDISESMQQDMISMPPPPPRRKPT
jgi:hypothetical protein